MIQFFFFAIFILTFIAGVFVHFSPHQNPPSSFKLMVDGGINSVDTYFRKKNEQVSISTYKGIVQIHKRLSNLALEQNKFLDTMQDQHQVLKNARQEILSVLQAQEKIAAQNKNNAGKSNNNYLIDLANNINDSTDPNTNNNVNNSLANISNGQEGSDKDILQLKALAAEMQDEDRLLTSHGQELISLNNAITQNRQTMADQLTYADIYTDSALRDLHKRNLMLEDQEQEFFDKIRAYNENFRDAMDRMRQKLKDFSTAAYYSKLQQQMTQDRVQNMLDKEREDMDILAELENRNRDIWKSEQEKIADSKEFASDSQQHAQDLIDEENQKAQDQQMDTQQRIEDQKEHMQDELAQQRMKNF